MDGGAMGGQGGAEIRPFQGLARAAPPNRSHADPPACGKGASLPIFPAGRRGITAARLGKATSEGQLPEPPD